MNSRHSADVLDSGFEIGSKAHAVVLCKACAIGGGRVGAKKIM